MAHIVTPESKKGQNNSASVRWSGNRTRITQIKMELIKFSGMNERAIAEFYYRDEV